MLAKTTKQIKIHVAYVFRGRSSQKQIKIESREREPSPIISEPIVAAIARAYRWQRLIESGEYASVTELAKAKGINQSYACRMMKMTLLSPRLIEAALDGRLPSSITQRDLTRPTSLLWNGQTLEHPD